MARREIKSYVVTDDLTGEEIPEDEAVSLQFTYGGQAYEIDLSSRNAKKLDDFMAPYIDKARRVRDSSPKRRNQPVDFSQARDLDAVRKWARENGYEVSDRGRIAKTVLDAYDKAN